MFQMNVDISFELVTIPKGAIAYVIVTIRDLMRLETIDSIKLIVLSYLRYATSFKMPFSCKQNKKTMPQTTNVSHKQTLWRNLEIIQTEVERRFPIEMKR